MTPHTVAVPACVAAFLLAGVPATFAQTPRLVIASPTAGDYVSDRVPIDVRLEPTDAAPVVTEHVFYADGKEVCRVPGPARPVCVWDAGAVVTSHQFRVVATLAAGGRLVASVRTRAIDVAENTSVRVVQVPVVATDRDGRFAAGLTRDAFSLTEDGRAQTIAHFSDEQAPLVVELAFDLSESMREALPDLKAAVAAFARRLPPGASVTLIAFNDEIYPLGQPADSVERRLEILKGLQAFGGTALFDVIRRGLDDLGRSAGRRALVVFTDGDDSASRATRVQVREAVESSDASVYFVALGRGREVEALLKGMADLASLSGGRALQAEKVSDLDKRFGEVLADLAHQYLLGYTSTNPTLDDQWRKIEVRLGRDGLRVRTRRGYRARPLDKQ